MRARACGAFALLALSALLSAFAPAGGLPSAPTIPQVTVRIDDVPPVEVNLDGTVNVTVNGTVDVSLPSWVETTIYFNTTVLETYWGATITPLQANLTGSGVVPFEVRIAVPGRASVDGGARLWVEANVSVPPGIGYGFSNETPVPVVQYFGLALTARTSSSPENFTAPAGADTAFAIRLQNLGNGRDSFELLVENLIELQGLGIAVSLPSPISVPARVTVNVNGNVSVPLSLTDGNYSLAIVAISTGAAAKGENVRASVEKGLRLVPPEAPPDGGGPPPEEPPKGFLPGPGAVGALGAVAAAAAVAVGVRRARPPSQGGAYRASPGPSRARRP